jgi:hypothetical protein
MNSCEDMAISPTIAFVEDADEVLEAATSIIGTGFM